MLLMFVGAFGMAFMAILTVAFAQAYIQESVWDRNALLFAVLSAVSFGMALSLLILTVGAAIDFLV